MRASVVVGLCCAVACACATPEPAAPTTTTSATATATTATTRATTAATSAASTALRWDVVVDDRFVVHEVVCGAGVGAVVPEDKDARGFVHDVFAQDGCVRFDLDLGAAARAYDDRDRAVRVADDIVAASPDVWLWHTRPARHGLLRLTVPDGWRAVVPFPPSRAEPGAYIVDASTWAFLSTAVFGKVQARQLEAAGAVFDVVTLPGELTMVRADVDRWLGGAAEAVATAHGGTFPFPRVQIVVDPVLASGVPFGMVQRGGGPQAFLLLGARARVDDVVADWVAVHELSHLLSPPVALDDTWLGEGIASYHQNILRARAGLLTPARAWESLRDGLERGAEAAERGPFTLSLQEASTRMRAEGRYLQTYWGGAAIVLLVDVALRQCGGGTVDDVFAALRAEQPVVDVRRVDADEFVARAAAAGAGCAHIRADVDAALRRPFPEVQPLLDALGVRAGALDDKAPLAAIRRQISARP